MLGNLCFDFLIFLFRELIRKHHKEGHTSCRSSKSGKKRRKHCYEAEPDGKSDLKRHKKKSKRRKLEKQFESANKIPLAEKKRTHKLRDSPDDLNSKERTNNLLEVVLCITMNFYIIELVDYR